MDDIAMVFETVIRKSYGCNRYEHDANADYYRKLQDDYISEMELPKHQEDFDKIKNALLEAFNHNGSGFDDLSHRLKDLNELNYGSIQELAYILGRAIERFIK